MSQGLKVVEMVVFFLMLKNALDAYNDNSLHK